MCFHICDCSACKTSKFDFGMFLNLCMFLIMIFLLLFFHVAKRKNWLQRWFVLDFNRQYLAYFENQQVCQFASRSANLKLVCH